MKITALTDTSDLRGRLADFSRIVGVESSHAVRQFARKACIYLATETQPFGDDDEGKVKGETAVARDIYKVYYPATGAKFLNQATRYVEGYYAKTNQPSNRAEKFKTRLLGYQMSGNTGALAGIAADIGFTDAQIEGFEPSRHRSSRDNRGRVRGAKPQLIIEGERQLEKYVETTQRKVGLTKAGWAKCAEAIPLNQAQSATRGIPQWVTRNKGRASGSINDQSQNPANPKVIMTNSTPWTSMVLTPSQANKALQLARNNFATYMNTAIKKTLRAQAKLKGAA
jgi:hypothetical protein